MGPQIAAALHFAAATRNCGLCEFNPNVLAMANRFLAEPLVCNEGRYQVPTKPRALESFGMSPFTTFATNPVLCPTSAPKSFRSTPDF